MSQTPAEREFRILERGDIRDRIVLGNFRAGLRSMVNPDTGETFTEEEIARATQAKTRFFIEADAIDSYGQGEQRRALFLSDQLQIDRANTKWLEDYHAALWEKPKLPASGGGGIVTVRGNVGTLILGSTTIPDPTAYAARDAAGKVYQVLLGATILAGGPAVVQMVCRDTGADTNPTEGTKLTWINRDPGMEVESVVAADFSGGTPPETDAEQSDRILSSIRYKEGSGNPPQLRAWAREASSAIEDAFVYPCALHSGSVVIAVTQKRSTTAGPLARLASYAVKQAATQALTPPGSASVPATPHVLVTGVQAYPRDVVLRLAMRSGTVAGWRDPTPFPSYSAVAPRISSVVSPTQLVLYSGADADLPAVPARLTDGSGYHYIDGTNIHLQAWNAATSAFVSLNVQRVTCTAPNTFRIDLNSAQTIAAQSIVSPLCGPRDTIAAAVSAYFDARGPGELMATTDPRFDRCQRFPPIAEKWPCNVGADLALSVLAALAGTASDATLAAGAWTATPPALEINGPLLATLGTVGVYPI